MSKKLTLLQIASVTFALISATVLFSIVPDSYKLYIIAGLYAGLGLLIFFMKNRLRTLGLHPEKITKGLTLALPFVCIIILGGTLIFLAEPTLFQDARYKHSFTTMLYTVLIVIPLYTVLIEELAFRGLFFGSLVKLIRPMQAAFIASFAFGLWHIVTAQNVSTASFIIPQPLLIFAVVVATTIAGLFFTWLRHKSGSVIAPMLVHWSLNATGVVLAYFAWLQ